MNSTNLISCVHKNIPLFQSLISKCPNIGTNSLHLPKKLKKYYPNQKNNQTLTGTNLLCLLPIKKISQAPTKETTLFHALLV